MNNPSEMFSFPEVRVVEASAGSGKTYALAKRYVQLVLKPQNYSTEAEVPRSQSAGGMRSILAITFTNKAASEMKARILYFLKAIALGQLPKAEAEEILAPLGLDEKTARAKAFAVMENLIHSYNFFQVQTIDKFIRTLLLSCALKISLTANFKIKTDSFNYLEYSLDELVDRGLTEPNIRKLFEQFLHNYLYLENRTGWFPKDDMMVILKSLYDETNVYGKSFYRSSVEPQDLMKKKRMILDEMKALKGLLPPEGVNKLFINGIASLLDGDPGGFEIDGLSKTFRHDDIPVNKNGEVSKQARDLWRRIRVQLRQLCEDEAHSLFNPYLDIFMLVNENFKERSSMDDVLFLEELNKKAGELFDEKQISIQELYYRLATRLRHYLIDEFQDTSRLQWSNLHGMTEEALSTGGSLFYVGDRKQAIYGFRGGDVGLFDDVKDNFQHFNAKRDVLSKNWRSHKAVVNFNNFIFDIQNLKALVARKHEKDAKDKNAVVFTDDDIAVMARHFQDTQQAFRADSGDGYVEVRTVDIDAKEEREEIIRQEVLSRFAELKGRFAYNEIALLTRSNAQVGQLTQWLLEAGIPVDSDRTSDIRIHPVIVDILCFLAFLNSPIDNLSFTRFILSDVFAKVSGVPQEKLHEFVFSLRAELTGQKNSYVYTYFRAQYPELWNDYIQEFFQNVGLYPLYELVVSALSKFKCFEHFPEAHGFLMHFLELLKTKEDEYGDLEGFLHYFENLTGDEPYVRGAHADAVTVLTVHKAKGLEFPVVIIPFLGMEVQVGAQAGDNKQAYVLRDKKEEVELIRLKKEYRLFSEKLKSYYDEEYKKSFLSELNNLYVALTRAKCELYVFVPSKVGRSANLAQLLLPAEYTSGEKKKYYLSKRSNAEAMRLEARGSTDWLAYLRDEFANVDDIVKRKERRQGEILHYALSCLGSLDVATAQKVIKDAAELTLYQWDLEGGVEDLEQRLKGVIYAPSVSPLFFCNNAIVENEKEFVNENGMTKRIDRLIITENEVWVIDFKSSSVEIEQNEEQIKDYMQLAKKIYPKHVVKGFLVYVDEKRVEEI